MRHGRSAGLRYSPCVRGVPASRHRRRCLPCFIAAVAVVRLSAFLALRLLLRLGGHDDAVVVFGVLQIVLGHHVVAGRQGVAGERRIFVGDHLGVAPDFHVRTVAFVIAGKRVLVTSVVTAATAAVAVALPATLLLWSHQTLMLSFTVLQVRIAPVRAGTRFSPYLIRANKLFVCVPRCRSRTIVRRKAGVRTGTFKFSVGCRTGGCIYVSRHQLGSLPMLHCQVIFSQQGTSSCHFTKKSARSCPNSPFFRRSGGIRGLRRESSRLVSGHGRFRLRALPGRDQ
jgi:hypothetical protein